MYHYNLYALLIIVCTCMWDDMIIQSLDHIVQLKTVLNLVKQTLPTSDFKDGSQSFLLINESELWKIFEKCYNAYCNW